MAYVIMTGLSQRDALEAAAAFLESEGHRVRVTDNGDKAISWIHEAPPDIMVLSGLTPRRVGMEILYEFKRVYPDRLVGIILITTLDPVAPGRPAAAWGNPWIDSHMIGPYTSWQIVLAVEQLIYRRITFPSEAQLQILLQTLARAVMLYAKDHQGKLPIMESVETLRTALRIDFGVHDSYFVSLLTQSTVLPNAALSGQNWQALATTSNVVAFYEASPDADGQHWVVMLGGELWSPRPRALKISNVELETLIQKRPRNSQPGI